MHDAIEQFRDALARRTIIPPTNIAADGAIHRCDTEGRNGKGDAAYLLHLDDIAAGGFENWRDGLGWETWRADIGRKLSPVEAAELSRRAAETKAIREAEDVQRRTEARERAAAKWQAAKPADPAHPYLVAKGVPPHGIRQDGDALLIPLRASGELHSIQSIAPDGSKRFLSGGRVSGCYFSIGKPDGTLCIVEGYATGASIFEATGYAVAVAFDAGNLEAVARELRGKLPDVRIILCADDDYRTDGDPGIAAATKAARAVDGLLAVPDFDDDRPQGATDFNDLARHAGADAIKRALANATAPEVAEHQPPAPSATAVDLAGVVLRRVSDIEAVPIRWLWPGRIARGKITMIAGHPGLGKSQITCALAAVVTKVGRWPVDGTPCELGSVAMLSAEDDVADTIRPRLEAAGADVTKVEMLDGVIDAFDLTGAPIQRSLNLRTDIAKLDTLFASHADLALLIVDPVSAYLGGTDSHVNADVRALLAPLSALAAKYAVAIVLVSHLNKGGANAEAISRVTGSLAFVAAARGAYIVAKDPENGDRRLFLPAKNNIGKDSDGLAFTVDPFALPGGIETSRILWEPNPVMTTADEAMRPAEDDGDRTMTEDAVELLRDILSAGRVLARDIKRRAGEAGISDKALRTARTRLQIGVSREGFGGDTRTYWSLHSCPVDPFVPSPAIGQNRAEMDPEGTNEVGNAFPIATNGDAHTATEEF